MTHPTNKPINTDEAAKYSGLASSTLEKMRVTGGGPPYLKIGRRVLYFRDDIEVWLQRHRRHHTSEEA
jgi:predicted DNA-binding transcriptional regulator AlpA